MSVMVSKRVHVYMADVEMWLKKSEMHVDYQDLVEWLKAIFTSQDDDLTQSQVY